MDYKRFMNSLCTGRETILGIKMFERVRKLAPPDAVYMGPGLPNYATFPIKKAVFHLSDGQTLTIDEEHMATALQYGLPQGIAQFLEQLKEIVQRYHSPPNWEKKDIVVTAGSLDAISKVVEMIVNPGDFIVIPDPVYQTFLTVTKVYNPHYLSVASDEEGMLPDSLREVLSRWRPEECRDAMFAVPKLMYTNPSGSNPTGVSLSNKRRQEIYDIASEYNLLIVEDDPYYFLQFEPRESWPKSFLSIDTDSRVLRCDSFSKIMSAGMRVGYLTGPKEIVDKITLHISASQIHASTLAQMVISELLRMWGKSGLEKHLDSVRSWYKAQKDATVDSAKKHLTGLCTWRAPDGGMFLWLKVLNVEDTFSLMKTAIIKGAQVSPGNAFVEGTKKKSPYLRVSYSMASPADIDKGLQRLAEAIRELTTSNGI